MNLKAYHKPVAFTTNIASITPLSDPTRYIKVFNQHERENRDRV
jgi:hypothetical protein